MTGKPYLASEDSALLRKALGMFSGERFLEIGAGNGGNLVEASKNFGTVMGIDLVRPSMTDWREGANFILADCASCVRPGCVDVVAFNPPYLPGEPGEDLAVEGGGALEVPMKFLEEALRVIRKEGRAIFLLNDEAQLGGFEKICDERGFAVRRLESKRVFFEELSVYEAFVPASKLRSNTVGGSADHSQAVTSATSLRRRAPASPS